jgi:hypothetical protein
MIEQLIFIVASSTTKFSRISEASAARTRELTDYFWHWMCSFERLHTWDATI